MREADRTHVALVGGGRIADMHAPGYLEDERARLYALCDLDPDVRARREREWGLARTYADYAALLADPRVDAVEILTPHHLHHRMVLDAAAAGKHVSVQKPMALTLAECDDMIAACRRAGVLLKVFENFVFHPPYRRAREVLESGAIGRPLALRARLGAGHGGWEVPLRAWAWRLAEGNVTVFDDGFHKLSVAVDFFGEVAEVAGFIERTLAVVDSPAALVWRHRSGVLGSLDAAMTPNLYVEGAYYPADERLEITGTKGAIHVTSCTGRPVEAPPLLVVRDGRVEAHTDLATDWLESFKASARDFVGAIREGREPHLTGARGREVTAFALAAIEAARSGRTLAPEPPAAAAPGRPALEARGGRP
jgi:predicted dehydrogenase